MKVTQRFVRPKHVTETQHLFFPLKHASVCWNYFKQAAEEDASGAIISYYVDLFISRSLFFLFWSTNTERDAFINRKQKACRTESVLQQGTDFALGLMMAEKHGPVLQKNVPAIPSSPTALKYRRHVCSTLWLRTVSGQNIPWCVCFCYASTPHMVFALQYIEISIFLHDISLIYLLLRKQTHKKYIYLLKSQV